MFILLLIGIMFLLFMFPASLAMSITKWSKEPISVLRKVKTKSGRIAKRTVKVQPKLEPVEVILCCIPILSACMVWKALYNRMGWTKFVAALIPIGFIFRVIVVFCTQSTLLFIISFYVLWACILAHQILYSVVYFVTARMYSCGVLVQILCLIFPEFAAYPLVSRVPKFMRELQESENVIGE